MQYFSTLTLDEIKIMVDYLEDANFSEGECIVKEKDPGDGCYLIESGYVRLEVLSDHTDTEMVLGYLEPGTALGEFSLIDKQPRSASAYADTDVTTLKLSTKSFEELCKKHSELGQKLLNFLCLQLSQKMRIANKQLRSFIVTDKVPDCHGISQLNL